MISLIGSGASQLAFPLLILALTGSPAQAGFAGALRGIPYIILSLPAGALIDRWNRKRAMILCDTGRALAMASIPIAYAIGHLTVVQLYIAALFEGIFFTFFNLAETACIPNVVEREQIAAAAAQNEITYNFTFLSGPYLGGILYNIGKVFPFLIDAISYTLSIISLSLIHAPFQEERGMPTRPLRAEIREGLLWLWHQPLIRYLALLTGCINLTLISCELIVIVIARGLRIPPYFIGLIFAVGGIGSTVGALLSPLAQRRFNFGHAVIAICWLFVLFWPLFFVAFQPIMLTIIFASISFLGPLYNVMQYSNRVALIPDVLQGRVNSVFRLVALGLQPLGSGITGVLLQFCGSTSTIIVFLVFLFALAFVTTRNYHVRNAPTVVVNK